jgi:hypothetical protein
LTQTPHAHRRRLVRSAAHVLSGRLPRHTLTNRTKGPLLRLGRITTSTSLLSRESNRDLLPSGNRHLPVNRHLRSGKASSSSACSQLAWRRTQEPVENSERTRLIDAQAFEEASRLFAVRAGGRYHRRLPKPPWFGIGDGKRTLQALRIWLLANFRVARHTLFTSCEPAPHGSSERGRSIRTRE